MITYSRFPSPPPPASPCGRSKARPCQRQVTVGLCVPAPPWICDPASTHTTIIPAFYSASSAIPLDPLHLSRPLSCLTSPLLSPPLCIPKYPSALPWLPLTSPARGIWLGRRQDKQQPVSPAADLLMPNQSLKPPCFSSSGNCHSDLFLPPSCKFAQNLPDVGMTVSIVSPPVSLSNSLKCPTGSGAIRGLGSQAGGGETCCLLAKIQAKPHRHPQGMG